MSIYDNDAVFEAGEDLRCEQYCAVAIRERRVYLAQEGQYASGFLMNCPNIRYPAVFQTKGPARAIVGEAVDVGAELIVGPKSRLIAAKGRSGLVVAFATEMARGLGDIIHVQIGINVHERIARLEALLKRHGIAYED